MKNLNVLGIRGLPAKHGGFETFAEKLCLFLVKKGWNVTVYCQESGAGEVYETTWCGVTRIHIPVKNEGPLGTIVFDLKSVLLACRGQGLHLTLGYNTACFNLLQRMAGITNVINMDGIEWRRQKWGVIAKTWFWLNERFGCWFGNHLVADHPRIEDHLATRVSRNKITMIPYGGVDVLGADEALISQYGITSNCYSILIARPEPENSILEVVEAFCASHRTDKLLVLGSFTPESNAYHSRVLDVANDSVIFPGAIYDAGTIAALRFHARYYVHGHQVGGTNPSLVEALGAGCAVIAHDNHFNRWVAADAGFYFTDVDSLADFFDTIYLDLEYQSLRKQQARIEFSTRFKWDDILSEYEVLLEKYL